MKNSHQLLCCWLASERNTIPLFSLCVVICVVVWCIALWMNSGVIVTKKEYLYFFISKGKNIYYYYAIVIIIIRIVSSVNDFGTRILTKKIVTEHKNGDEQRNNVEHEQLQRRTAKTTTWLSSEAVSLPPPSLFPLLPLFVYTFRPTCFGSAGKQLGGDDGGGCIRDGSSSYQSGYHY